MARARWRTDRAVLGDHLLLAFGIEAGTMSAERPVSCARRQVVLLDVVPLRAERVVVMHGLAGTSRVPRSNFRHLVSPPLLSISLLSAVTDNARRAARSMDLRADGIRSRNLESDAPRCSCLFPGSAQSLLSTARAVTRAVTARASLSLQGILPASSTLSRRSSRSPACISGAGGRRAVLLLSPS